MSGCTLEWNQNSFKTSLGRSTLAYSNLFRGAHVSIVLIPLKARLLTSGNEYFSFQLGEKLRSLTGVFLTKQQKILGRCCPCLLLTPPSPTGVLNQFSSAVGRKQTAETWFQAPSARVNFYVVQTRRGVSCQVPGCTDTERAFPFLDKGKTFRILFAQSS